VRFVLASTLCALTFVSAHAQTSDQVVTVNFLTAGEPDSLDPNRASFAYAVDGAVVRNVFETLLRFDDQLVPQPAAAQSFEVSPDGTTYTFHVRADATWSDGQPVTARDFEYSWRRLLASQNQYAPLFNAAGITGVTAPDDLTFQVQLSQPFGALPDLAALWVGAPLRADIVNSDPGGWAADAGTYIGNGPFMVSEWVHGDHLTLVPNPRYTAHSGWTLPTLTKVTVLMETNPEQAYAAYTAGTGPDWTLVPDQEANSVLNDASLTSQSRKYTELTTFWLQINTARPPLNNTLARRALSKAVDRAALVRDLASGVSVPTTSVIPPGMPGFQPDVGHDLDFDPAGARALWTQAGLNSSNVLTFGYRDTPSDLRRAQWFQEQLSTNLGVTVQLSTSGDSDLSFGGWSGDYPDPQDWMAPVFGCNAPFNTSKFCDTTFDQLVARADTTSAMGDRLTLYAQAQTQLLQDAPIAPLFNRGRLVLSKPWVDGLKLVPADDYPGSMFLDEVRILPH
jgi:oligopeptide transport system substrate-binding protein